MTHRRTDICCKSCQGS